ncbi:hypothetical protein FFA43_08975 [Campylobacter hyointestinalis subsp. hyointestinalis]|uniref:Secreted protein n=1 Tax=Campylobacter hyointestinalis subsp. hyointestinalis TaxID=91352 RepID=A0A9W5AU10_CAMHY|nr:hypothetical protein [Campylobacter hyointestinalis]PPB58045.1 hypothetical protein CDQ71_03770 [Campylobacter hyointestinalis subsp. hyointestinalis]PPB68589.1 hypothetical protein CDQ76_05680 [Campylobacter hyointestinalis subsp. hyointestinalis]QCU00741.1 hypothetical protein FFA43_08975 [Campylobacter hyointestinalis subsp. hyointestinalis]TWO22501.1 hypothetical protein YZ80_03655 [Campylobacter hyointestinalis]CUU73621.1 Uncharacterised protein [Campylobacter hyointestinalis subsp. hy
MKNKLLVLLTFVLLVVTYANAYDYGCNSNQNRMQQNYDNFQNDVSRRNQQMQSVGRDDFYDNNLPSTPRW